MIARSSRPARRGALETKLEQLERVNEDIDHPNRIVRVDPVFQIFREQCRLVAIHTLDKSLYPITPIRTLEESHQTSKFKNIFFTQAGSGANIL